MPSKPVSARFATAALCATLGCAGIVLSCSQGAVRDAMLSSTYRPYATGMPKPVPFPIAATSPYVVLAGDMHCHVAPPDSTSDVTRGFAETVKLAKQEGLDFVVLTPHVVSRFFLDEAQRDGVSASQKALRAEIAKTTSPTLFIPGFEYTDHRFGHVGVSFADLDAVLADVPVSEAKLHPEKFFESWVAHGGNLVVNHPLVTPLDSIVSIARADLSWRPWTSKGPYPAEILAVDRLAQGYEAYNIPATTLRDPLLVGRPDVTLLATLEHLDKQIASDARRRSPVGGSDSHGHTLRATTFVLAKARTIEAIHDALVEGRTCIRSPEACSLEARAGEGDPWHPIGSALPPASSLEVRAHGKGIDVFVDGQLVASPQSDEVVKIAPKASGCSVVRVRVDAGYSAPIYVGCFTEK
ncbi:MAG: hypothetical protein ABI175_15860 [Polyangiales bacterium]